MASNVEARAEAAEPIAPAIATAPARAAAVSTLALGVAACGGGGGDGGGGGGGAFAGGGGGTPAPTVAAPQNDTEAARFLLQTSFAASPAAIQQVQDQGYEPWLDAQMNQQNSQTAQQYFAARGYDQVDSNQWYNRRDPGDYMIWSQLMSGGSSVRKRVALAMSEFFVVSFNSIGIAHRSPAIGEYWDILNRNAFGSYRQLLEDITLNPAMGVFLNTRGNRKADPNKGRVPDENYGREIMQLFSIGLFELNPDGTERLNGGNPIETYDNDDVTGIAKVFTGYDYDFTNVSETQAFNGTWMVPDALYVRQPMTADGSRWRWTTNQSFHSEEEKTFLGLTIPAGTGPEESLRLALDHLVEHPNVGPFFSRQMIQRLVTSNPSPAYVQRVADVFANNGSGTRGDLRAVFKAILLDDEALNIANASDPAFGKLREPMLRFVQLGRTFGIRSTSGNFEIRELSDPASRLGQSPLRPPSVFNFFRPTYFPTMSQAAANNLVAPEFQIVNETSVAGYVNFLERAIDNSVWYLDDVELDYSAETAIADDSTALVDRLDLLLTANQLSDDVRSTIIGALDTITIDAGSEAEDRLQRVHTAVLLVMASTDYLVQK
ncbi:hypothetical protein AUC45_06520 [Erythrobacter sp. YT30]|nr:hypothetical protein AUC45_06520 [Erythrobacter sp. YT30]